MNKKTIALLAITSLMLSACSSEKETQSEVTPNKDQPVKVKLQLDWYPESAHGGFYQALLKGYYEAAGLEVEIAAGGPGVLPLQTVATGRAEFTLGRIDDALIGLDKKLPITLVMSYMQRDPQAIMFHASNPIEDWNDLNGKTIMLNPGNAFAEVLRKRRQIDFNVIPLDYGIQRFLADENFIQQCFVTSQPFYAKQKGVEVGVMLLSDSEYSPERVVVVNKSYAKAHPDVVSAFVEASIEGWRDYITGDAGETHGLLLDLNKGNTPELNAYSRDAMAEYQIVFGNPDEGEALGLIDKEKLKSTIATLRELEIIDSGLSTADVIDYSILPDAVSRPILKPAP